MFMVMHLQWKIMGQDTGTNFQINTVGNTVYSHKTTLYDATTVIELLTNLAEMEKYCYSLPK